MQNCTTILGIIDMRQRGISYDIAVADTKLAAAQLLCS